MKKYSQFHDGYFDGIWIDGKTAYIFLATHEHERYVMVAGGVASLVANRIRQGNIIFEVLERISEELVLQDIIDVHEVQDRAAEEVWIAKRLQRAQREGEKIFEVNPSYGGSCLVLAASLSLFPYEDWIAQYGFGLTH